MRRYNGKVRFLETDIILLPVKSTRSKVARLQMTADNHYRYMVNLGILRM